MEWTITKMRTMKWGIVYWTEQKGSILNAIYHVETNRAGVAESGLRSVFPDIGCLLLPVSHLFHFSSLSIHKYTDITITQLYYSSSIIIFKKSWYVYYLVAAIRVIRFQYSVGDASSRLNRLFNSYIDDATRTLVPSTCWWWCWTSSDMASNGLGRRRRLFSNTVAQTEIF